MRYAIQKRKRFERVGIPSLPCPFCRRRIQLYRHWQDASIRNRLHKHLYRECHKYAKCGGDWKDWIKRCCALVLKARAAARPKWKRLTPKQLRAAQSRGGEINPSRTSASEVRTRRPKTNGAVDFLRCTGVGTSREASRFRRARCAVRRL